MKLFITSSIIALATAQSPSRHFVGLFDSPLGQQHIPYPVDQCVNVAVSLSSTTYGVYSCSDDGSSISYTDYGDDASCTDPERANGGPTYTMNGLQAGDLFSFTCVGTDNYIELKSMINDPTCCNGAPAFTKVATGACYADLNGEYVSTVCDETTATQYGYADSVCDPAGVSLEPVFELFTDRCVIFDTAFFLVNIHTVLNRCVVDGTTLIEPTFCGAKDVNSTDVSASVATIITPQTSTLPPITTGAVSRPLISTSAQTADVRPTNAQNAVSSTERVERLSSTINRLTTASRQIE